MDRLSTTALIILAIPAFAAAQHRGGVSAPAVHASAPVSHSAPSAGMRVQSGSGGAARIGSPVLRSRNNGVRILNRNNNAFGSNGTSFQGVPGLGFDFPHLAAVSGNRRVRGGRFFGGAPFGFGGFLLSPSFVEGVPVGDSGTVAAEDEVVDDPPDMERPVRRSRAARSTGESEVSSQPAPQPDVQQYVFVRQDGSLVFAIAYAWENSTLRYITPEGIRRSIGREALDLNATQQFNEQRGLNFRIPA
jgi:hypothetical protein